MNILINLLVLALIITLLFFCKNFFWDHWLSKKSFYRLSCLRMFHSLSFPKYYLTISHANPMQVYLQEDSCEFVLKCPRCGDMINNRPVTSPGHDYKWQYIEENSCKGIRRCSRCGDEIVDESIHHQLENWQYIKDNSCEMLGECSRCGHIDKKTVHEYGDYSFLKNSCYEERSCERCGDTQMEHDLLGKYKSRYVTAHGAGITICNKCGKSGRFGVGTLLNTDAYPRPPE